MFTMGMSTVAHIIYLSIFVTWLDYGFKGVCIATALQFASRFFFAQTYVYFIEPYKKSNNVKLFSRATTSNLSE